MRPLRGLFERRQNRRGCGGDAVGDFLAGIEHFRIAQQRAERRGEMGKEARPMGEDAVETRHERLSGELRLENGERG